MKIEIKTTIEDETIVSEEIHFDLFTEAIRGIHQFVIATREKQVREALEKLGWTPPKEKEE